MASGTAVFIPSNEANIIQTAPGLPNVALQASGATPYSQYGAQQLGIPTNALQQVPQKGPLERFLKAEPKVLGVGMCCQILIGLIHIGFGAVLLLSNYPEFHSLSAIGGYPFWGGIFFISSGSLCVSAANSPNHALVKSSAGMNITSAIMSLAGIFLYISDLIIYSQRYSHQYPTYIREYTTDRLSSVGCGLSSVLLLFSMLEFCITVSLAHFGCQAACCIDAQRTVMFMPYQLIGGGAVAAEPNHPPAPPTYDNVVTESQ
ncbi:membrane-spanning 4-domains subfamily A member 15-like [Thamnophis elegans]|uniref:membrane-spanning 4-domains subfamily A member 15-like n=1 Tax=Thamnophis elegans TaxID=35005 RepID=UPI0013774C70|nr:membrane-spanning 4-domains subfamily A member 15-like [Thamnophis elegans]